MGKSLKNCRSRSELERYTMGKGKKRKGRKTKVLEFAIFSKISLNRAT